MMLVWCLILIPIIAIVDGGFLGWMFSLGKGWGALTGMGMTASVLYGQVIYSAWH